MNAINKVTEKYASPISRIVAPNARGMKSKNENLAAFSFSIPRNIADEIVIPLLETPGKSARIWNKPMINADLFDNCFLLTGIFVSNKIVPVKRNAIPINNKELSADSIMSLNKNPNSAAGIVAIIRYFQS